MDSASVRDEAGATDLLSTRNGAGILFFRGGRIQFINEQATACLRLLQPVALKKESRGIPSVSPVGGGSRRRREGKG